MTARLGNVPSQSGIDGLAPFRFNGKASQIGFRDSKVRLGILASGRDAVS